MNAMMPKKMPARTSLLILPLMCMFVLMNSSSCSLSGGDGGPHIPEIPVTHDLEYYKSPGAYTINFPFPQAGIITNFGIRPSLYTQAQMNAQCVAALEDWVKYWITETNCPAGSARPHMGPGPGLPSYAEAYGTLSEFIGWGMIVCVLMDNAQNRTRHLFELLNNFRKAYTNQYGLMMSTIKFHNPMDSYNRDSATEADENMAMALVMAHYQWGSDGETDYLSEALDLLNNISTHLVERPANVLKPAATWGGSDLLDPCYYDSIYYPLWFTLTGDSTWTKLDEHYRFLVTYFCNTYGTGLLPDWCRADGTDTGIPYKPYLYSYDAHQVPIKWAIHYAWYGTSKTEVFANAAELFCDWQEREADGDFGSLYDIYTLDGRPAGTFRMGPMGAAGIISAAHRDIVNYTYQSVLNMDSSASYNWGGALGKVSQLLILSGNFVNFTDLDSE
jgi:hypothetical protein